MIVTAYRYKDIKEVYRLQRKLVTTYEAACIAVRTVYTNTGGKTPGVDGEIWDSPIKRIGEIVTNIAKYSPQPVKRIMIPKANSKELRPLGIPTMIDRAVQKLYSMAIDPIIEETSDLHSYGFRKHRSVIDAHMRVYGTINSCYSAQWVLETDIEKCFDKIDHKFILDNIVICDKVVIEKWLKAGILSNKELLQTTEGTPQGGIISPLLCNLVLNGLEEAITAEIGKKENKGITQGKPKVNMVRYADDLIVTGRTKEILETLVKPAIERFLRERGLNMKESKTKIVNTKEGFDFLGMNFKVQPYRYKLNVKKKTKDNICIIQPSAKNILKMKDAIRKVIKPSNNILTIIKELNPKLKGWINYYRTFYYSIKPLYDLHAYLWKKMDLWARRKHKKWGFAKIADTYLPYYKKARRRPGVSKWEWGASPDHILFNMRQIKSWRPSTLKTSEILNPYSKEGIEYYSKRKIHMAETKYKLFVLRKYEYKCALCSEPLNNGEHIEFHHLLPRKEGGSWNPKNIQPLHRVCHQQVTYKSYKDNTKNNINK